MHRYVQRIAVRGSSAAGGSSSARRVTRQEEFGSEGGHESEEVDDPIAEQDKDYVAHSSDADEGMSDDHPEMTDYEEELEDEEGIGENGPNSEEMITTPAGIDFDAAAQMKSSVHKAFRQNEEDERLGMRQCTLCPKKIKSPGQQTSNMWKHLLSRHPRVHANLKKDSEERKLKQSQAKCDGSQNPGTVMESRAAGAKLNSQPQLKECLKRSNGLKLELEHNLFEFFSREPEASFKLLESQYFKKLLKMKTGAPVPTSKEMAEVMKRKASLLCTVVTEDLSKLPHMSLVLSIAGEKAGSKKYLVVGLAYCDPAFNMEKLVLTTTTINLFNFTEKDVQLFLEFTKVKFSIDVTKLVSILVPVGRRIASAVQMFTRNNMIEDIPIITCLHSQLSVIDAEVTEYITAKEPSFAKVQALLEFLRKQDGMLLLKTGRIPIREFDSSKSLIESTTLLLKWAQKLHAAAGIWSVKSFDKEQPTLLTAEEMGTLTEILKVLNWFHTNVTAFESVAFVHTSELTNYRDSFEDKLTGFALTKPSAQDIRRKLLGKLSSVILEPDNFVALSTLLDPRVKCRSRMNDAGSERSAKILADQILRESEEENGDFPLAEERCEDIAEDNLPRGLVRTSHRNGPEWNDQVDDAGPYCRAMRDYINLVDPPKVNADFNLFWKKKSAESAFSPLYNIASKHFSSVGVNCNPRLVDTPEADHIKSDLLFLRYLPQKYKEI